MYRRTWPLIKTREKCRVTAEEGGENARSSTSLMSDHQQEEQPSDRHNLKDVGDICRICHIGGFPPIIEKQATWERQSENIQRDESQLSTLSAYAYLGPLISVCKCRGTVGLVHAECLERWLTESGHTRCELCGYKYATKRIPRHNVLRSVLIWFNTVVATRQMMFDILYLVATTPLALFSCYICALAFRMLVETGFYEIPWMILAMLPTCCLTLVAYWGWLITLGRLHSRRWRRYWRSNFVIRLVPANIDNVSDLNNEDNRTVFSGEDGDDNELEHWRDEDYDEFLELLQ